MTSEPSSSESVPSEPAGSPDSSGDSGASSSVSPVGAIAKLFLLLLVLAIGGVGVLYAIGSNEMEFLVEQEINGKRKDIYKWLTDPEEVKKWVEGVEKIEPIKDGKDENQSDAYRVGAKSLVTVASGGNSFDMTQEVSKARLNQETEFKLSSDLFDVVQHFKLDFKNDAGLSSDIVVVRQTYRIQFKGLYRIMAPFARTSIQDQLNRNMKKLKSLVEGSAEETKDDTAKDGSAEKKKDAAKKKKG